jgi:apolipoprotein D and lipocalin family protein
VTVRRVLFVALALGWAPLLQGQTTKLEVVPTIDFSQYAGKWYEIARLPNSFEDQCVGDVTATYMLESDGKIKVINECRVKNGKIDRAEGVARLADENGPRAKLKIRFAPAIFSILPWVWGDYWILDLAPDYSYAIVGEPDRKYLWILARTPKIDESTYTELLEKVRQMGFPAESLIRTNQD